MLDPADLAAQQVARYADVQLVALLTAEPDRADEFLADTLGRLARRRRGDPGDRAAPSCASWAAPPGRRERLYTHRNTVLRRLARADELLPRPLAEHAVEVAAALEVLRWRGVAAP